jgi:hypothetical protein
LLDRLDADDSAQRATRRRPAGFEIARVHLQRPMQRAQRLVVTIQRRAASAEMKVETAENPAGSQSPRCNSGSPAPLPALTGSTPSRCSASALVGRSRARADTPPRRWRDRRRCA